MNNARIASAPQNTENTPNTSAARTNEDRSDAQQLTLLPDVLDAPARRRPTPSVNARFLLSQDTRELGLRQVAEIRRQLAARKAARESANVVPMPERTERAA